MSSKNCREHQVQGGVLSADLTFILNHFFVVFSLLNFKGGATIT
jgi:hypothetical protein